MKNFIINAGRYHHEQKHFYSIQKTRQITGNTEKALKNTHKLLGNKYFSEFTTKI